MSKQVSAAESGQFSMIAIVFTLLITAILTAVVVGVMVGTGGGNSSSTGPAAFADDIQAQQNLTNVVHSADEAGSSLVALQGANPSLTISTSPSTGPSAISVGSGPAGPSSGGGGGGVGRGPITGGQPIPGAPGITLPPGVSTGGASTGNTGAGAAPAAAGAPGTTLAVKSTSGTCWYAYVGSPVWYGAQTGQTSCQAPNLAAVPAQGTPSNSAIGWAQGSFPIVSGD